MSSSLEAYTPYYNLNANDNHVEDRFFGNWGHHKAMTEWCFHQWRGLMKECLTCKASARPAFSDVAARLRDMLAALDLLSPATISEPAQAF